MTDGEQVVKHLHKQMSSDDYNQEVGLVCLNQSVYLKSNNPNVSLDDMLQKGLRTLRDLVLEDGSK